MTDLNHAQAPDWISVPGDTIADRLDELGWTQKELAERLGYTTKHVSQLITGKAAITEDTALRLEHVLGSTARFWLEREAQYREALARQEELESLAAKKAWLKELPIQDMIRFGWIKRYYHKGQQVAECMNFFGVASIDAWRARYTRVGAAFRASPAFDRNGAAVGAWLRQAERQAATVDCATFDKRGFTQVLEEARALTNETEPEAFLPILSESCRRVGVALVLEPAPRGCPISGAAQWLGKNKAMIALSLRHKTNDHLWFSFFHEAGHITLHAKRLQFIDLDDGLDDEQEREADAFAQDHLIPPEALVELRGMLPSEAAVRAFAARVGIAPGIVVGRLQNEGLLPWSHLNKLKVRYVWPHEAR
ncbi:MAG: HigA family addiction module antidote protein [Ectothiorhodospiraceae bacterium]|nr:HigA family addiction module antidote protein [Ectothiorhodospiraceae bacterium]